MVLTLYVRNVRSLRKIQLIQQRRQLFLFTATAVSFMGIANTALY